MATLFLTPNNNVTRLSIRLSSGHSCTLGSSAAADYCLDEDIDEIHCRITCRGNLSFIECVDFEAKVRVNQEVINRSSLSSGDVLGIGKQEFSVEVRSDAEVLDVSDEPILADSLSESDLSVDEMLDPVPLDPVPLDSVPLDSVPDESDLPDRALNSEKEEILDIENDSATVDGFEIDEYGFDEDFKVISSGPAASSEIYQEEQELALFDPDKDKDDHSTTEIAGESVESDGVELTVGNESTLAEVSVSRSILKETPSKPGDAKSSSFLKSLIGKSYLSKLTGKKALAAANTFFANESPKIFEVIEEGIQELDDVEDCSVASPDGRVILFSHLEKTELSILLRKRRWHGRIRFPLGLQRFLELSGTVSRSFFDSIGACLVVLESGNDFEFITYSSDDEETTED